MKNNNKKIAIVHYTYPPVIGGVESVIQNHARILTKNGYRVKIITGEGGKDEKIDVKVIPQLTSLTLIDEYLDRKIKRGILPNRFYQLKDEISSRLRDELKEVDICIIHNIMTMHFNLPLTCALDEIIDKLSNNVKFYLWCHDCALLNPSYTDDIPDRNLYPWNLLSKFNPKVNYIAISEVRKKQLASLFSIDEDLIQVIPVGLEIKSFLNISDPVWNLAWDKGFFESDTVQKGQGIKDEFIKLVKWFEIYHSEDLYNNLWLIPLTGTWKDLWYDSAYSGYYHYVNDVYH